MRATAPFDLPRSECFAEDLHDLLMPAPQPVLPPAPLRLWELPVLTLAVALLGACVANAPI